MANESTDTKNETSEAPPLILEINSEVNDFYAQISIIAIFYRSTWSLLIETGFLGEETGTYFAFFFIFMKSRFIFAVFIYLPVSC